MAAEGGAPAGRPAGGSWRIPLVRPSIPPLSTYAAALEPVWETRMLSNFASKAQELEGLVRAYTGEEHVLSVSSCDVGLTLAIAALGLPEGAEAVVPSFTFNSTLNAVVWNRLRPRFVDVDSDTYGLDPAAVDDAITDATALVVATHVFGSACEVGGLGAVAARRSLPLLYDAAQAFATFVDGVHVGAFGDASVYSLSGTKVVTAAEGGIAVLRSPAAARAFRHLRSYGFNYDYVSRYVGLNGKLSELHAALGCLTVASVERQVAARAELVERYRKRLDGGAVRFQAVPEGIRPSYTYVAIEVDERDAVMAHLEGLGIQSKAYFRPLHRMPPFQGFPRGPLPVTERLAETVLCLPLFADLTEPDLDLVCDAVAEAAGAAGRAARHVG